MSGRHAAPKRRKVEYEDDAFASCVGRMIQAMGKRASSNPEGLALLLTLRQLLDEEIETAGAALAKEANFSLGELSVFMTEFGHPLSRQAAQQRWGETALLKKAQGRKARAEADMAKAESEIAALEELRQSRPLKSRERQKLDRLTAKREGAAATLARLAHVDLESVDLHDREKVSNVIKLAVQRVEHAAQTAFGMSREEARAAGRAAVLSFAAAQARRQAEQQPATDHQAHAV